ncbi:MAG: hypothetical protein QOI35_1294, partial [Cryptosporangiaceae bacterium]|nr:hypothetical protein [Cryptosporangiaceae bacterium]
MKYKVDFSTVRLKPDSPAGLIPAVWIAATPATR